MVLRQRWFLAIVLQGMAALVGGLLQSPSPAQESRPAQPKAAKTDAQTIRDLIERLADDSFDEREQAGKHLVAIGEPALVRLRHAAKEHPDPEVRERAGRLIGAIQKALFGQVRQFEGHGGQPLHWVTRVAVTPDGRQAVSAGFDGLRCWDLAGGKEILAFGEIKGSCWGLAIARDGRRVIAGCSDRGARVFDLKTGKLVQQLVGHTGEVWAAALSADGKRAVTGAWDQSLRVWDVDTGKQVQACRGVRGHVRCLALSPDGKMVAAGHFERTNGPGIVRLWDVDKGEEVGALEGHTLEVTSVAFSPDGKTLLSSSFDRTVRIWDVATGKQRQRCEGHSGRVEGAAFTPDGRRVVSCGDQDNPTLRLWDVASGEQLQESESVPEGFLSVAVLPDGHQCVTTGKDGVVRLWHWTR